MENGKATELKATFLLSTALLIFGSAASGAIVTYNRAAFQAAVISGGVQQQDFDSLADGVITTVNGVTYDASGGDALVTSMFLTTSGSKGLGSTSLGFFGSTESALLTFAAPITAFGIDVNTFANTEGAYRATLNTGDSALSAFDVFPGESTGQFIGITSDTAFTSVTITPLTGYTYTLDTLVYGEAERVINPIPEPSTFVVVLSSVAFLALRARRKAA